MLFTQGEPTNPIRRALTLGDSNQSNKRSNNWGKVPVQRNKCHPGSLAAILGGLLESLDFF